MDSIKRPKSSFFRLDGTGYTLIKVVDNELKSVFKNPDETSKTGMITGLFDDIIKRIKDNSVAEIEDDFIKRVNEINAV